MKYVSEFTARLIFNQRENIIETETEPCGMPSPICWSIVAERRDSRNYNDESNYIKLFFRKTRELAEKRSLIICSVSKSITRLGDQVSSASSAFLGGFSSFIRKKSRQKVLWINNVTVEFVFYRFSPLLNEIWTRWHSIREFGSGFQIRFVCESFKGERWCFSFFQ